MALYFRVTCVGCLQLSKNIERRQVVSAETARSFITLPNLPFSGSGSKKKEYSERRLLG
jgi:hypothetical protein